ncbi:collagen binding domain-containing protein [Anaerocolumna xylanovorans]|uniref:Uncharacterized surface anchored protein n=1 Tax=Anaerocolumna xylanovorans DSM 12503 TaxID=1121345 RepID=A0A1M7Y7A8_9FIRM|nr:collagen binding domain-containing protein [Anaerocolumna xylanovorans]SHO48494.1 Uncharacterized surface anchored protein [Anaerocolumna xylanovorans DSM 12503]
MNISKKIKSSISKMLVFVLLLSLCGGSLPGTLAYAAGEPRQLSPEEAYITSVALKVNGVEINSGNVNQDPIGQDSTVDLFINWKLANTNPINEGDYMEVDFPVQYFDGLNEAVNGNLNSSQGDIGTYSFSDDGKLRLTFKATVQLDIEGTVILSQVPFKIPASGSNPVEITFPVSGSAITYVKFQPKNISDTLTKKGAANANLNASYIDWEVDLNQKLEHITNAMVEDSIPENLTLEESSLEVYKLEVGLDGAKIVTGSAITGITNTGSGGELKIALGEIDGAYRIKYRTTIDPAGIGQTSFTNEVKLSGQKPGAPEGFLEKKSATVSTPRGAVLKKGVELDRSYNPNSINWTVYVNLSETTINKAIIKDTLPAGLELPGSVKITPIKYNGSGWVDDGGALSAAEYTAEIDANPIKITFNNQINRAYKLEYTTDITNRTKTSFTNSADIYDTSETTPLNQKPETAKADITRGVYLTKLGDDSHIDYEDKYIDWTVDINKREESINAPKLTDKIGDGLGIPTDFKIVKLGIGPNGEETPGEDVTSNFISGKYTYDPAAKSYTIDFGPQITGAYRITYRTGIEDVNQGSYTNKATLSGTVGGVGIGTGTGTDWNGRDVTKTPTIKNTVGKVNTGIDYANKTLSWGITIDPKKEPMKSLVITDTFQTVFTSGKIVEGGQKLKSGTVVVKRDGTPLEEGSGKDYTLSVNSDEGGFVITFLKDVQGAVYTINYQTRFDREWSEQDGLLLKQYQNTAASKWTEDSKGDVTPLPIVVKKDIKDSAAHNGAKNGTVILNGTGRAAREIDWTVDVNYLSENLKNFVVTDNGWDTTQLKLKTDSVKIYNCTTDANGNVIRGSEVTNLTAAGIQVTKGDGGFIINFGTVTSPYRISYTTELLNQSQGMYTNTAAVTGIRNGSNEPVSDTLTKTVTFPDNKQDVFLTKEGKQRDGNKPYIDWTIQFNTSLSLIRDAVLTDTLSAGHNYVYGSIKVEKRIPAGYLEVIPGGTTYSVNITEDPVTKVQSFRLEFAGEINNEYKITYATKISDNVVNNASLSNRIEFAGNGVTTSNNSKDNDITVKKISSGGTATGEIGEFTITKVDASDSGIKLQGAKFQLLKLNHDVIYDSLVTGEDGTVTVLINRAGIIDGDYYLKEITAPNGYQLPDSSDSSNWIPVTLNTSKFNAVTVTNQKLRKIQIIKKDADGTTPLEGAEFKITGPGLSGVSYQTDSSGRIMIGNLVFGTYTIEELTPPGGYQLPDDNIMTVTLNASSSQVTDVTCVNEKLRKLVIKKTDKATSTEKLSGAEFEVKDSKGTVVAHLTTDSNGTASVDNLKFDTYTVTEVKAPTGYVIGAPIPVKIDNTKMEFEVTVKNEKVTATPSAEPSQEPTNTPASPTPTVPTNTPASPTPTVPTNTPASPTPTVPTNTPASPTPTVSVSPTPVPTKAPTGTPIPTPSSKPTLTPTPEPIVEITPENTPKGGKVPVPEGSTTSPGKEPDNGKVTVDKDGNWIYTPDPGFTGKDEFTVTVTHPDGTTEEIPIHIDVDKVPLGNGPKDSDKTGSGDKGKGPHIPKTGENIPIGILPIALTGMAAGVIAVTGRKKKMGNSK